MLLLNYKDDLLFACLHLVLTAPQELFFVGDLVPILQTALKLGTNNMVIAGMALDSLEQWPITYLSKSEVRMCEQLYAKILPLLRPYLAINTFDSELQVDSAISKKKHAKVKLLIVDDALEREKDQQSLRDIQFRIAAFLGKLGGLNQLLLRNSENSRDALNWDPEKRLTFAIPFIDVNLKVYFGIDIKLIFRRSSS